MKNILFGFFLCITFCNLSNAKGMTASVELSSLNEEIKSLKSEHDRLKKDVIVLINKSRKADTRITSLESENKYLATKIDSLCKRLSTLSANQQSDKSELSSIIGKTNEKVQATEDTISSRTLWGILGIISLLLALALTILAFVRKFKSGNSSIYEVRKAQDALKVAQQKMQEESIQLDNKLIELLSKHDISSPATTETGEVDHSLTLKVADEIVKIEMNLSRMDDSIKGYKQLAKGVQRIKDNFKANDYEIVDMLGKQYQAGMKAAVTFVTDENLEAGQQIITRIIKPQVNYKQKMIQAAQIEVSQSE